MGNEECEQYHRNPEIPEAHFAQLISETGEIGDEWGRPYLGAKETGHADKSTCKDKTLCIMLVLNYLGMGLSLAYL